MMTRPPTAPTRARPCTSDPPGSPVVSSRRAGRASVTRLLQRLQGGDRQPRRADDDRVRSRPSVDGVEDAPGDAERAGKRARPSDDGETVWRGHALARDV